MAVVELQYRSTPDGLFFISACLDKQPMVRDGVTGDWVGTLQGHKGAVWSAKLDAAACRAATGSSDFTACVWDAINGDVLTTLEHGHIVKGVDLTRDGARLATGCLDKKLRVFDLARPDAPPAVLLHADKLRKVLWVPGEQAVLTGAEDGVVRLWDLRSGAVAAQQLLGGPGVAVTDLELSPDGAVLTAAAGTSAFICGAAGLEVQRRHALDVVVEAASLHPTLRHRLVIGGADTSVRVLDAATGALVSSLKGHHAPVHCVRFAPDGDTFSSGAGDATVRIWKLGDDAAVPSKPGASSGGAASAALPATQEGIVA